MSVTNYRIYCTSEDAWTEGWGITTPSVCYNNNAHSVNLNSIQELHTIYDDPTIVNGKLSVTIDDSKNLFGDVKVRDYEPIVQNYALYGMMNDQLYTSYVSGSGGITANQNGTEIDAYIGANLYDYSVVRSRKVVKYRPGYSNVVRFNTVFDTGVTNCLQFAGIGNMGSDLYFCYSGTEFGVRYSTGGFPHVVELGITSAESDNETATVTLNGVEYNVPLTNANSDINFTASEIALGVTYTGWNVDIVGDKIIFMAKSVGPRNGTYSFSSSGISTGFFSTQKIGQSLTTTFVPKSAWNGSSTMIATLNELNRNMYCIEYAWYGSANFNFLIYNPSTSRYELVHTFTFANTQTEPSISSPNMFIQWGVASLGSTSPKKIRIAGGFATTDGKIVLQYPIHGVSSYKTLAANTEKIIIAIKNRQIINGYANNSEIEILRLTVVGNGAHPSKIQIIKNPATLSTNSTSDYINWNFICKQNSISLLSSSCNTYTGGTVLDTFQIPKDGSLYIDLKNKGFTLFQNDIIIVTAESRSTSEIDLAITLLEDV